MSSSLQGRAVEELKLILEPLRDVVADPDSVEEMFRFLGWDVNGSSGSPNAAIVNALQAVVETVDDIGRWVESPPETLGDLHELLTDISGLVSTIRGLSSISVDGVDLSQLGATLFQDLVTIRIARGFPKTFTVLSALGVVRERAQELDYRSGRFATSLPELDVAQVGRLLSDPVGELRDIYFPSDLASRSDANEAASRLFPAVARVLRSIGAETSFGAGNGPTGLSSEDEQRLTGVLKVLYQLPAVDSVTAGATLTLIPQDEGGPGLAIAPFGTFGLERSSGGWSTTLEGSVAGVGELRITSSGVQVVSDAGATELSAKLVLDRSNSEGPALAIGSTSDSRLEIGKFKVVAKGLFRSDRSDYSLELGVGQGLLVVGAGDGDGFLQKILPPDGFRGTFDFAIGWSSLDGIYFRGSAGLEITIPVHASLGPLTIESIYLAVTLQSGGDIDVKLAGTFSAEIGPIAASVKRIGITSTLSFGDGGNLGPLNIDAPGFLPPTGAGLVVDAGAVTGGGYVEFDKDKGEYAGILQLDFSSIGLVAIGLITTKMPDGSKGFSMMINIGVTFNPPFQLSMGFALAGVGGLIGIHRSVNVDVLRDGIRKKTLDSILFPEDAIKNAAKIISDMRAVFPPQQGRFVVGPMVKITWGLQLLQIDLGVIIEVPSPVRIIILGQVAALIPSPEAAVVELHLDVLGVIDFAKQELTVDITIYDSRILILDLYGDGAIFLGWGSPAQFLMSLGGWHPKFSPPARFADLRRLTIEMKVGSVLHLSFKIYQALTSNTLQFGTRFDLLVNLEAIRVEGYFGFDALFYFSPFSFDASMAAGVSIKVFGETLAAIHLELALSGPTPWHANGLAKFEILWWELEAKFDKTWGDSDAARLDAINPLPQLLEAVGKAANWSGVLAGGAIAVEALRELSAPATETDEELVYAHPAGALEIRQRVLPLDIELSKFNSAPIRDYSRFDVEAAGAFTGVEAPVQDQFARAQFDDVSNAQKLSIPSYEKFKAGIAVGAEAVDHGVDEPGTFEFEAILLDDLAFSEEELTEIWQDAPPPLVGKLPGWRAAYLLMAGAVGRAGALKAGNMKFAVRGRTPDVAVVDEVYSIADTDDLGRTAGTAASYGSRTAADQALGADVEGAQVVLEHEVAA